MKKIYFIFTLLNSIVAISQAGAPAAPYYNGFDWTLRGMNLKNALATKITDTHTKKLTYGEAENSIKETDLDPTDLTNTNVLLFYGFDNSTVCAYVDETTFGNSTNSDEHRKRHREADEVQTSPDTKYCEWNREHVFAKALGNPKLDDGGTSDAGEDAHHIRSSDVVRNANRGNIKFASGSGNSGPSGGYWYPGDEWKGDTARMMMYMYLRYGSQCLPRYVGIGNSVSNDIDMIDLFLQWNAEDPVSQLEDNRNTYHGNTANAYAQGNRNPFIDNPYLATLIWGGTAAQNRWAILSNDDFTLTDNFKILPNPSNGNFRIEYDNTIGDINVEIFSTVGQKVFEKQNINDNIITTNGLQSGVYLIKIAKDSKSIVKKIVIN